MSYVILLKKEDIEISAFLTATLAWGQRPVILKNARQLMARMDDAPYDFVIHSNKQERLKVDIFVHRTFNRTDCQFFMSSFKYIYIHYGGQEDSFFPLNEQIPVKEAIIRFRQVFLALPHPRRTEKHISDPGRNSASKRINMLMRII
ncbi:MAG: DUF2400 family protein [Bacteroidetes bacterium]|nr:DUF2400 family protein [Bacteroidota bacterium]